MPQPATRGPPETFFFSRFSGFASTTTLKKPTKRVNVSTQQTTVDLITIYWWRDDGKAALYFPERCKVKGFGS